MKNVEYLYNFGHFFLLYKLVVRHFWGVIFSQCIN